MDAYVMWGTTWAVNDLEMNLLALGMWVWLFINGETVGDP